MSTQTVKVEFPGGKKVNARVGDFLIQNDQSVRAGGEASAPEPFDHFLASIATCAGIYVLGFCQKRDIDTSGVSLLQNPLRDKDDKIVGTEKDIGKR